MYAFLGLHPRVLNLWKEVHPVWKWKTQYAHGKMTW